MRMMMLLTLNGDAATTGGYCVIPPLIILLLLAMNPPLFMFGGMVEEVEKMLARCRPLCRWTAAPVSEDRVMKAAQMIATPMLGHTVAAASAAARGIGNGSGRSERAVWMKRRWMTQSVMHIVILLAPGNRAELIYQWRRPRLRRLARIAGQQLQGTRRDSAVL